ncbi:uncharacterized protein MELLADRAFT_60178 [Melampsora larici-populina 98AG31]|uniref:Uncharacterized protein n=1 Tax=Melampsora larici-populina (strain 98AG31 / pathotype 3-4-7) TaxID=747676 RepID=F4RAD2_MELLP|nr:uncharacterized protein MELLADRAFT_60178 [Melampsora larici-populina 98AG31]EGG10462.1 hypothetical protein MELLADRAFT_60178 [Melampsora larici-populina 98AG31]
MTSDLGSFAKKRARTNTPGFEAELQAAEVTGTPRSQRIKNLFPEKADSTSLKEMVSKLLEVVKESIPLAGKHKTTKKIQIDIDTAADILVLTGAVYDQFMYEDAKRNFTTPGSLMNPTQKPRNIVFKGRETEDKLDTIVESLSFLHKALGQNPGLTQKTTSLKTPTTPSYALAASKHASATSKSTTLPAKQRAPASRPPPKPRSSNVITLVHEVGTEITLPNLSNAKMIQEINIAFRAYQILAQAMDARSL